MNHTVKTSPHDLKSTVFSIVPFPITEVKPGLFPNTFSLPASKNNKPVALTIGTCIHYVYIDGDRGSLQVRDSSAEVAKSICEDYINSQLGINEGAYPGLAWLPGEITAEQFADQWPQTLAELKVAQRNWFGILCRIADTDWKRYQQHNVISEFQRIAARDIGLKPEAHLWMDQAVPEAELTCPMCGSAHKPAQVICLGCKFILNQDEYAEANFAR